MHRASFTKEGFVVDPFARETYPASIRVIDGAIASIDRLAPEASRRELPFIVPCFVDAHGHPEATLVSPIEYARAALANGVAAAVIDPHEIANVLGSEGLAFFHDHFAGMPFRFACGAPSSAGLSLAEIEFLLDRPMITHLSEVMDFPGVILGTSPALPAIRLALARGKPVDGHAPGISGENLVALARAGISTDHECVSLEDARAKADAGISVQIRFGVRGNGDALLPLISSHPDRAMLCSDGPDPRFLAGGYIADSVRRALAADNSVYDVVRAASVNPVEHYRIPLGLVRPGDSADFLCVDGPETMGVREVYVGGERVYDGTAVCVGDRRFPPIVAMGSAPIGESDLSVPVRPGLLRVIEAYDGEHITAVSERAPRAEGGFAVADLDRDILKLVLLNRYVPSRPIVAFVRGFGLRRGAIATSVSHDRHHILAVGSDDRSIVRAVNRVVEARGGMVCADADSVVAELELAIAGLVGTMTVPETVGRVEGLARAANALGCVFRYPFETLSYLAMDFFPELKITEGGLRSPREAGPISLFR